MLNMMMIHLFLVSLSILLLEAQHMGHQHPHGDTKPDTDLQPNTFFSHGEGHNYYYDYPEYGLPATITDTTDLETEIVSRWNSDEVTTTTPRFWWNHDEFTTMDVTCNENEWRCLDGHFCLPESSRCDGNIECLDISDEDYCDAENDFRTGIHASGSLVSFCSLLWIVPVILMSY